MIKLKDILQNVGTEELIIVLFSLFYDELNKELADVYRGIVDELRDKEVIPNADNTRLVISHITDKTCKWEEPGTDYYSMSGYNGTTYRDNVSDRYFDDGHADDYLDPDSEQPFCLSLSEWGAWLDFYIDDDTRSKFSDNVILAHAIYEMTEMGFTEKEILDIKNILDERSAELDKQIENGEENIGISMEDLYVKIEKKYGCLKESN
jgi:hypothetical protein